MYKLLVLCLLFVPPVLAAESPVFLSESFENLDNWDPLYFPKIKEHSTYTVYTEPDGNTVLKTESKGSASGLLLKRSFKVNEYPVLSWRWKITKVYEKGDATRKSGDDYPLRVYVNFKYDPDRASFWKRTKYSSAKLLYDEYPPHSSLNFIWANRPHKERILTSPYADEVKSIVLQAGATKANSWQSETVNIVELYREAFGEDPPLEASLAIMNDSDNTEDSGVAYLDDLKLTR